jgi:hypothetical protein
MITWLDFYNFLHFVGLAFGLGGATIMTIISIKAEKYKEVALAMGRIGPLIVKLIWVGLLLLIISGIALPFYITWPLDKTMLLIKHILVAFIVIIGIILGISSRKGLRKQMKILVIINLILWYLVTLLSVLV